MSNYKPLNVREGSKFIRHIWNLVCLPHWDAEFFIEPWKHQEESDCAEFVLHPKGRSVPKIFFFTNDPEVIKRLISSRGKVYLFGAYNEHDVCQMRVKGTIIDASQHADHGRIKTKILARLCKGLGRRRQKLSPEEVNRRLELVSKGKLFCFTPEEYAYASYERG